MPRRLLPLLAAVLSWPVLAAPVPLDRDAVSGARSAYTLSTRGDYRVNMRHGVSRLLSGHRHTLGVIFHDAA